MNIREKLMAEAMFFVDGLKKDKNVLAVILTGSAAWGNVTEKSDLDILAIVNDENGVRYRYMLPKYCEVKRRTEIGYFPLSFVDRAIKRGYGDVIPLRVREQLKNGRVLYQRERIGTDIIERCKNAGAAKSAIGFLMYKSKEMIKNAGIQIKNKDNATACIDARIAAELAARTFLLWEKNAYASKYKHLYRYLKKYSNNLTVYEQIDDIKNIDSEQAKEAVENAIMFIEKVFREFHIKQDFAKKAETTRS